MTNGEDSVVQVGSMVRIRDAYLEHHEEEEWRIVAGHEADALHGCMSENCAMARALLGHKAGERVRVNGPLGSNMVAILAVTNVEPVTTRGV